MSDVQPDTPAPEAVPEAPAPEAAPEPAAPVAEPTPIGSDTEHNLTVANVLGTVENPGGVSGVSVKLAADADAKVDGFVLTVAHDIAHLFAEGERWVLSKVH